MKLKWRINILLVFDITLAPLAWKVHTWYSTRAIIHLNVYEPQWSIGRMSGLVRFLCLFLTNPVAGLNQDDIILGKEAAKNSFEMITLAISCGLRVRHVPR